MPYAERKPSGMTQIQETVFINRVLAEVNEVRSIVDLAPLKALPKGHIGDSARCPQGVALTGQGCSVSVDAGSISISRTIPALTIKTGQGTIVYSTTQQEIELKTPKNMARFINLFDDGKLPQFRK